jgi:hypothetical protein
MTSGGLPYVDRNKPAIRKNHSTALVCIWGIDTVSRGAGYLLGIWVAGPREGAMTRAEQRRRVLKAKVALALYSEYGRVPQEKQIDEVYHVTRVLYKAALNTHYLRKRLKTGQLALF